MKILADGLIKNAKRKITVVCAVENSQLQFINAAHLQLREVQNRIKSVLFAISFSKRTTVIPSKHIIFNTKLLNNLHKLYLADEEFNRVVEWYNVKPKKSYSEF